MDIVALIGMILTYGLTQFFKKNPSVKEHAPLVVTILSAVVAAIQAAMAATIAVAQEPGTVVTQPHTFFGQAVTYFLWNVGGSVWMQNGIKKWVGEYLIGTLAKKFLK